MTRDTDDSATLQVADKLILFMVCAQVLHSDVNPIYDHYTRTVSEWTKDNTILFGLRDMTRRSRDCLAVTLAPYKFSHLLTYARFSAADDFITNQFLTLQQAVRV